MPDQAAAAPTDLAQLTVHNLKTPLTGILASIEMLAEGDLGPLNARQRETLLDVHARSEELLDLVDDLLQLWRLEVESFELLLEPIDPQDLLSVLRQDWAVAFERAGARLNLDLAGGAPVFPGDRALLRRALGNLLHNALVHAGDRVSVTCAATADADFVCFSVADDGVGISAEFHEVILEKFGRGPGIPHGTRGTGLGLPFCRVAAAAHGGDLWVESEPGRGSTFRLRIPAGSGPGAPPGA